MAYPYTLAAALLLASVCIFGDKFRAKSHHRWWISIAGGVSVSTVFIDLLPEISEKQARFSAAADHSAALFPEQAIYLYALTGFVLFYGLQYLMAASASGEGAPSGLFSSFRLAAFAGYSALIAYLIVHNVWNSGPSLVLYTFAMSFHLLLVSHALAGEQHASYKKRGRWILVLAILVGWSAGVFTSIPDQVEARITGFVCGSVIMNTLVVELPEGRGGRFWPFVLAAAVYALILILVLG